MKCRNDRCRTNVLEELDRGFNQLMNALPSSESVRSDDPRLSISELENRYIVECDLPGVAQENVSLQIEDRVLTISGQRTAVAVGDNVKVLFNERPGVRFARQIPLGKDVDQTSVDAELNNGVLRITIPKRTDLMPRKIEIRRSTTSS
jgi:HSP20 family protein